MTATNIFQPYTFTRSGLTAKNRITLAPCLLYTSDAADERSSVDLGGRRIIKKKKTINNKKKKEKHRKENKKKTRKQKE